MPDTARSRRAALRQATAKPFERGRRPISPIGDKIADGSHVGDVFARVGPQDDQVSDLVEYLKSL